MPINYVENIPWQRLTHPLNFEGPAVVQGLTNDLLVVPGQDKGKTPLVKVYRGNHFEHGAAESGKLRLDEGDFVVNLKMIGKKFKLVPNIGRIVRVALVGEAPTAMQYLQPDTQSPYHGMSSTGDYSVSFDFIVTEKNPVLVKLGEASVQIVREGKAFFVLNGSEKVPFKPDKSTDIAHINIGRERWATPKGYSVAFENQVVVDAPSVSRYHARIDYHAGVFNIVDQSSTNGTSYRRL